MFTLQDITSELLLIARIHQSPRNDWAQQNSKRFESDESRVWDPGITELDAVTKNNMDQGVVASECDNDDTDLERVDLDTHANIVVLGRNCCIVSHSGIMAEINPFRSDHEALKVPI